MQQVSIKQAFWDYNFTEDQLLRKLTYGTKEEKAWIIGRILENLPFNSIWKYITLTQVKDFFPYLHLRPKLKQIWSYTLSLWEKYEKTSHFGDVKTFGKTRVDSIENIGSNKITAIFGRTEAKDFIDLYLILQKKLFTFQKLLQDAKKKDLGLSEFYLAHMLMGVKNLKNFPKMLIPFNKKSMENYFILLANKLLLEVKPKEVQDR